MSRTDIIEAYEAGLITRDEALEQGLVDTLDALYERSARTQGWGRRDGYAQPRRQMGR